MPIFVTCILIGAAIGFVAQFFYPGSKKAVGFILTAVLGIIGAALATVFFANPISIVIGAIIVLFIWERLVAYGLVRAPGGKA